jgi:hypothetical protein
MHTRLADLARASTCSAYAEPRDDGRKVSALVWCVPLVAFWVIVWASLT